MSEVTNSVSNKAGTTEPGATEAVAGLATANNKKQHKKQISFDTEAAAEVSTTAASARNSLAVATEPGAEVDTAASANMNNKTQKTNIMIQPLMVVVDAASSNSRNKKRSKAGPTEAV